MIPQERKTIPFVCSSCLTVFELSVREAGGNVPKLIYFEISLKTAKKSSANILVKQVVGKWLEAL